MTELTALPLEAPRPLMRELPPADPYPIDALGDVLGAAARAIHDRVQAPPAICGQSVLAAGALAVQGHADVVLPIGTGQPRPLSLYLLSLALSGERKSACDGEAMLPIREREAALRAAYDGDILSYTNDRAAYDGARHSAEKAGKGNREATRAALDALGAPPAPPLTPMLTCPEPTYEGMCRLLVTGQPTIGIFSAEGGQFIAGHGMTDEARLRTAAGISALWDGEPIRRVRVGDGATVLPGRRVSMHLMVQPGVADFWLGDRLLIDQGLLSRVLPTAPDSAMGSRLSHAEAQQTAPALKHYCARLLEILETPLPLASAGRPNELAPRPLELSAAAGRLWSAFVDQVEKRLTRDGELRPISGLANKLPEHAARIGGVLALIRDIKTSEVSGTDMAAGIELAQHFAAEALRLDGGSRISAELRRAQAVLDWLLMHWMEPVISLPDLYRLGPTAIRDAKTARQAVGILEDHGWLVRVAGGAVVANTPRREAWCVARVCSP